MTTIWAPDFSVVEPFASSAAEPRERARIDWMMLSLVALCALSAVIGRLCYIIRPFDSDGSMFIYMGRLISEGGRFCHELVDNKFPSVGLITSVPWRWFGPSWTSHVLLGAAMSLISGAMLARIATRTFGEHARLPAILFGLVYLNFNFAVFGGFQLETIQVLFTVIAAGAALEWLRDHDWRDAFVAALASGVAAMCKPTGLAPLAAFAVISLVTAPRATPRHAAALAAGLFLPVTVVIAHLIHTDTLRNMPDLWRQISRYAANSSWDPIDWTKPLTILVLGGFPLLVRGVIFRRDKIEATPQRVASWFVVVWLMLEIIGVAAQRRMYAYHFLVLVPPLTLLFAMIPRQVRVAPLAAALVPTALFSIYGGSLVLEICYTGRPRLEVSDYVAAHTMPSDAVWKDDASRLWLETNCRAGSRFPMTFLFANYDEAALEYGAQILGDFDRTRPKYIVLPVERQRWVAHQCKYILELARVPARRQNYETAWNRIFEYVDRNYSLEKRIGSDCVYRRRD